MNRRQMLAISGGTLLAASRRLAAQAAQTGRDEPAGSIESRAAYLKSMLQVLCRAPRPAGSAEFDAGADLILREMERARLQVTLDRFEFTRWSPLGEAEFEAGGRRLETYIAALSPGTPNGGARGKLRKAANGYEIADPQSGRLLADVRISQFGRAVVELHSAAGEIPLFCIGREDAGWLNKVMRQGLPVRANGQVQWTPHVATANVVGTLPGESKEEILIVAHADTMYDTPGANDNTASMICMLMVGHALSGMQPRKTVRFLASTGEELASMGAKHYAVVRKDAGTLGDIKACINLDSLTYGPNLQIATTDAKLAQMILTIHRDLGIHSEPKVLHQDDTMDSAPFLPGGARTVHLNSRGDNARTLPLWHRPEDLAETVNPAFVESSFRVLVELVNRLQAT